MKTSKLSKIILSVSCAAVVSFGCGPSMAFANKKLSQVLAHTPKDIKTTGSIRSGLEVGDKVSALPQDYKRIYVRNIPFYKAGGVFYKYDAKTKDFIVVENPVRLPIFSLASDKSKKADKKLATKSTTKKVVKGATKSATKSAKHSILMAPGPVIVKPEPKKLTKAQLSLDAKPVFKAKAVTKKDEPKVVAKHVAPKVVAKHVAPKVVAKHVAPKVVVKHVAPKVVAKTHAKTNHVAPIVKAPSNAVLKVEPKKVVKPVKHIAPKVVAKKAMVAKEAVVAKKLAIKPSLKAGDVVSVLPKDAHVKVINGVQYQQAGKTLYLPTVGANNRVVYVVVKA